MAKTITFLKENAVRVYTGMSVIFRDHSEALNVSELAPKFNGCYATNNSVLCFIHKDEVFVTPYTNATVRALKAAGFRKSEFYVPFSNGDYPQTEQSMWRTLLAKAREEN
ncbi:MAG: hypothetical protein Q4D76_20280 [Oscillospiraceae bacterium]|nr:hypothetical protein [Oscillospiraceae bacterium]